MVSASPLSHKVSWRQTTALARSFVRLLVHFLCLGIMTAAIIKPTKYYWAAAIHRKICTEYRPSVLWTKGYEQKGYLQSGLFISTCMSNIDHWRQSLLSSLCIFFKMNEPNYIRLFRSLPLFHNTHTQCKFLMYSCRWIVFSH